MFYYFDIDVATEFGMAAAVLFQNIAFWVRHNEANKRQIHYHNNKYWSYNSMNAFSELFPFLTDYAIRKALKDLEDAGLIISDDFNDKPFDRTKWYSIGPLGEEIVKAQSVADVVKGVGARCVENQHIDSLNSTNALFEFNGPIPDNKPDNKQKETISREINFSTYSKEKVENDGEVAAEGTPPRSKYAETAATFLNSPITLEAFCKNNRVTPEQCAAVVNEIVTEWEFAQPRHNNDTEAKFQLLRALETKIRIKKEHGLLDLNTQDRKEMFAQECKALKEEGYSKEDVARFYKYYIQSAQDGSGKALFETYKAWNTKTRFKMFINPQRHG